MILDGFYLHFGLESIILERVWKMLSAKWGVQIAGMILGARSKSMQNFGILYQITVEHIFQYKLQ